MVWWLIRFRDETKKMWTWIDKELSGEHDFVVEFCERTAQGRQTNSFAVDGLEIWSAIKHGLNIAATFTTGRRNRPKWQWASIVVERSQLTRIRWQENWTVVAKNANPKRADRLIHTYHMGSFCSSCSCQIRSIPLCRLHAKTGLPLAGDSCLSLASLSSELKSDPDRAFLKTITARLQTLLGIYLIEILSKHSSDDIYLGQKTILNGRRMQSH